MVNEVSIQSTTFDDQVIATIRCCIIHATEHRACSLFLISMRTASFSGVKPASSTTVPPESETVTTFAPRSSAFFTAYWATLPDPDTPAVWAKLARRYANHPGVMFDLLNEPHDRVETDPYPLWRPDGTEYPQDHCRVSIGEWKPWAELLIDTIRAEAPETPLFVSGTNWGYDLRGLPVDRDNIVYSAHVYRNKGDDWWGAFGHLAESVPVFVGEFGGGDLHDFSHGALRVIAPRAPLRHFERLRMY